MRHRPPGPGVVSQEFPDETIVIHLDTGTYYSLNPAAAAVWGLACAGHTLEEAIEACGGDGLAAGITQTWTKLVEAKLVRPAPPGEQAPAAAQAVKLAAMPEIAAYADMEDLFKLDPVHDVDESGWPSTMPAPPDSKA